MMKSWECNCGRINPPAEKKCLTCKALRAAEPILFRPMRLQWTEEEIQDICNHYAGNKIKCLSPSGEIKIPTKILMANPAGDYEEVWMKTTDDLCILIKKGDHWAMPEPEPMAHRVIWSVPKEGFSDDESKILDFWNTRVREKAVEILAKHVGVGAHGDFINCSTKPLVDAVVEALQFNNLKSK